jgi:hypothetical protein
MPSAANLHPSQKKLDKIKSQEDAKKEEVVGKNKYLKENSHSSFLQSSSPNPQVDLNSIMKKSQTRVRKTLEGKPEFVMSLVETQNELKSLASRNHLVIGDPMYNRLDDKQRSGFRHLHISPDIWDYVCRNSEGNIYNLYTDV